MNAIDFASDSAFHHLFYRDPTATEVRDFGLWLRGHPNDFVSLYHGTLDRNPVMEKGLLPTTDLRRRSLQSTAGSVYLSVYPGMAKTFGEMGYPGSSVVVYKVSLTIRRLKADTDQLRNQRQFAKRAVGKSLAESLAYGHGAKVNGKIDCMNLSKWEES